MTTTTSMDDLSANSVSEAVVLALAGVRDVDHLELSPLGESVNPFALDMLFEDDSFAGNVTLQYEESEISVTSDGDITVTR